MAVAVLSTLLVWAGPAQVLYFGGIAAGMAPMALALAVCFSSIRFLPMTLAIVPLLRGGGDTAVKASFGRMAYAAHFVAITVWTESLRRLPGMPAERRFPYYMGFAHTCLLFSAISTGAGYFLMGAMPVPLAAGLLFLTPLFFTVSASASARRLQDWAAIVLGFALEVPIRAVAGDSVDLLVVGVVGGTIAWIIGRRGGRT